MLSGETAAGAYPELAVRTMAKICLEAESTLDYGDVFKRIMQHSPVPMSPLESLASSAVRTANSAKATIILVLTRGGSTAKLVAKYRPGMPILSVVVPEIKTDSFDWSCSNESPARHSLIFRGLVPALYAGSAKASHAETTEEALVFAVEHAKAKGLCKKGDSAVALHRVGTASVIKIIFVKTVTSDCLGHIFKAISHILQSSSNLQESCFENILFQKPLPGPSLVPLKLRVLAKIKAPFLPRLITNPPFTHLLGLPLPLQLLQTLLPSPRL
ncbi:hypothetical protein Dsin_032814 [Dipteronia sinensis]|uniref:Pyruvate kinase C-terminal domain-containing protein n=1 Tax=Dipteronia sinensis TaxID=43782 RepID=A0AAD9ZEQ0_9ROSI|nr:hypothetical protein Dsin_032814 [Dipteronia sinensis]